jgi:uncharacterized protein YdeI (YjbR/CyaY-like superfamily)
MQGPDATEILVFADAAEWESWLRDNHATSNGTWLVIAKKGSAIASVTISDALDVALCYGWIDSQRKGHDSNSYVQRYSPRRRRSAWSRLNVARVEVLIEAGRMRERGLAEVDAAKSDGRWAAAYAGQRSATVPADLAAALEKHDRARSAFERLGRPAQYAVYLPVLKATSPAERASRISKAIADLEA